MPRDLDWLHDRVQRLGSADERRGRVDLVHRHTTRAAAAGRARAPRRTGELARSIQARRHRDGSTLRAADHLLPVEAGGASTGSPWVVVPLPGQRVGRDERLVSVRDRRGRVLLGRATRGRALRIVALLTRRVTRRGVDVLRTPVDRMGRELPAALGDDLVGVFRGD